MRRHVIAPAARFLQVPNELIRDPRLSAAAVRLLTWQLSYPDANDEPLAQTARKACLGKSTFQRAKKELKGAGYLHEWRRQGERGRWCTYQFVSGVPLTAEAACAAWRGADPAVRVARSREEETRAEPAARFPAAGPPAGRRTGPQPLQDRGENTTDPPSPEAVPPAPEAEQSAQPQSEPASGQLDAAVTLLLGLRRSEPRLAMSAHKARGWAPLAAEWLERGLNPGEIHRTLTLGMDTVRSPLGVLDWRLRHALPDPEPERSAQPRPEPRIARMRECAEAAHTQPLLFMPESGDEDIRCPECRRARAGGASAASAASAEPQAAPRSGLAGFRAARSASKRTGEARRKSVKGTSGTNTVKRSLCGPSAAQEAAP